MYLKLLNEFQPYYFNLEKKIILTNEKNYCVVKYGSLELICILNIINTSKVNDSISFVPVATL